MSRLLLALCLALAPLAAAAQKADAAQVDAVSSAAECLALGLPEKWKQLQVVIDLPKPLADTGGVLYLVTLPDDRVTPFQPCDTLSAAMTFLTCGFKKPGSTGGFTKGAVTTN